MRTTIATHELLPKGLYLEKPEHRDRARQHLCGVEDHEAPPGGSGRAGRGSSRSRTHARSKGSSPSTTSGRAGGSRR